jgi:hypothetical protein
VSLLHILVEQHSKEVQGKVRISWDTVSRLINRRYYDCQNKWNTIKKATLKVRTERFSYPVFLQQFVTTFTIQFFGSANMT